MDGTGFVILLADLLRRAGELSAINPWPTVRAAAGFLVKHGPESEQNRWEENAGYSTYTMAVEIAALLAAADFADEAKDSRVAEYLRETADIWNSDIDQWTYATDTRSLIKSASMVIMFVSPLRTSRKLDRFWMSS